MAISNFSGARLAVPPLGGELGQLFIAVMLGRYFTPAVAAEVLGHAAVLVSAAFGAILIGYASSCVLARFTRIDHATTFFASLPGSATEMANRGGLFGTAVDKVAVAHSLRILMLVCTFPVSLTIADVHGGDVYRPVVVPFAWAAGIFVPSMILTAAPGGIAEVSITARTLQLGVALLFGRPGDLIGRNGRGAAPVLDPFWSP